MYSRKITCKKLLRMSFGIALGLSLNTVSGQVADVTKTASDTIGETETIGEVVVTALGVTREERALGYSVQNVKSKDISSVPATNVVNNLSGKLSGVYITGSSSGPTASANVTIRGATSLNGNSQALFIVNGVPITNGLFSPGDGLNGSTTIDFGNASQVINPYDIESVSVLKGPAAAALYGTRAANGVIYITTKNGSNSKGWGVSVNSNVFFESPLKMPDYQNQYGFGGYGKYSYNGGSTYTGDYYDAFGENWGPRLDGTPIKQFNSDGQAVPFDAAEGNIRDFFRTGVNATNNIAISHGDENGDFRLSYTNLNRTGIVPNTDLTRNILQTSIGRSFKDKLDIRMNGMMVNSGSSNVPNAGYDESSSIMYSWLWFPRGVNMADMQNYWKPGQENVQQRYVEELWGNNPYFLVNENTNSFDSRRIIGDINATYHFNDQLNFRLRHGADMMNDIRQYRRATSTKGVPFGSFREDRIAFSESNTEALLSWTNYDRENASNPLRIDVKAGGNIMMQESSSLIANNPQLLQPGVFTLTNNRSSVQTENRVARKQINSLFGLASIAYNRYLYVDLSARNDWSSTLPPENSSFFYPSASVSFVPTELMQRNPTLNFLKVRAAYAEVGSDTDPYLLNNTYSPEPLFGSSPAFGINRFATNPNLLPERTSSYEAGLSAKLFRNKIGVDFTYYSMLTKDQIIYLPVATTTGRSSRLANGGSIQNNGIELSINADVVKNDKFVWNTRLNLGRNQAVVASLPDGVENGYPIVADMYPNDGGSADMEYVAVEGELLGQIKGLTFQRDADGNIIHKDGLPLMSDEKSTIGSYQPDFRIGWMNSFSYGQWQMSILFDAQVGGKIYSRSHALYNTGGAITNNDDPLLDMSTLDGRRTYNISYDANGEPVYDLVDEGGVVGKGVMYDDQGNIVQNDVKVPTRDYFYAYYGNGFNRDNVEAATYDASYLKLRELRVSYALTSEQAKKIGFSGLTVSLVGRNLLLFTNVPSIDPETYSIRGGLFIPGYESTQMPSIRSFGISLNATL